MAIKAGSILHVANQFVLDRIQTGGPGTLNIPQDKVYELGNYRSVGIVRDVPDLTFTIECLDVGSEVESLLVGGTDPLADPESTKYDLSVNTPIDIISPWKAPYGAFQAVRGVVIPNLALEGASYRFGLKDNAGETFTLRGDQIYYVPGTPWQENFTGDGTATLFAFTHGPALLYVESGKNIYALSVSVNGAHLTRGADYTETATGVTLATAPDTGAIVRVTYGSAPSTDPLYPQAGSSPFGTGAGNLVHQGVDVKPAAIRGKDIDVFFSTLVGGSPVEVRWPDVQSLTLDWKLTLESDYEFGNTHAVNRSATDVPAVTGSAELRPRSVEAFFTRLTQITGVPASQIIGPQSSVAGALRVELRNPDSGGTSTVPAGTVLKTFYVPDARFTIPGYEGRVQTKVNSTVTFESDSGLLDVFKGVRT